MVMNDGEIQQIGTPEEIYNQPHNLFVADFIGEPPFNFFDGRLVADGEELNFISNEANIDVPIPDSIRDKVAPMTGKAVKLGIRPMFISPSLSETAESQIRGTVYVFEDLGEHGVLAVEVNGDLVRITTDPAFGAKSGDTVWLTLDTNQVHVFDPESGLNLLFAR
jgi:multiple sugar transport system ATP-binding protein